MKPISQETFYQEVQKYWKTVVHRAKAMDLLLLHELLESYRQFFNTFQAGDYYFLLFDIYQGKIAEASPELFSVLGYEPKAMDMPLFMENIHPQDRAYFLNFERLVTSFFNTVPLDKIADYKVQYDLRVSKQDGTYVRLLIQYFLVNYEDRNLYHSLHVHTDITHLQKQGQPSCSIIGLHGAPSYYNIQDQDRVTSGNELFTVREREVLKGIVEGMSSGEIADRLCLSIHTINSHRKNILAKARVRTPLQLIKKLIDKGWI